MRISDWSSDVCSSDLQFNGAIAPLDVFDPDYNVPIAFSTVPASDLLTTLDQTGIYIQEQALVGGLTVTGSARYDWVNGRNIVRNFGNRVINGDANAFTWRVGAIYETMIGVAPYVSYSTSFLPSTGSTFSGDPLLPTRGEQYERSEEHTSELQSLMRISYAVFCLKKKKKS